MSTVPLIASASDIPRALRHADRHVGSRVYVARKLSSMGQAHQIPASWGLTAAGPSAAVREKAADRGQALPDGSYPIRNKADLHRAIQAFGRAKDKTAAKRHIIKRARALGAVSELPEDWGVTAAITAAGWDNRLHPRGRDGRFIEKFGILDLFDGIDFDKPSARGEAIGLRNENGKDIITVRVTKVQPGSSRKVGEEVDLEPNRVASAPDAKATVRPDKVAKGDIVRYTGQDIEEAKKGQEFNVESVDDYGRVTTDNGTVIDPGKYEMARRRARPDEAGDDSDVVPGPPPAKPDTAPSAKFGEGDVVRVPDGSTITVSSVDDENGTVTGARADGHSVTVPADGLEMARRKRRETDTDKIEPSKMKTDGPAVITSPKVNQGPPDPKSPDYVDAEMLDAQLRQSLAELGIDPDAPAGDAPEGATDDAPEGFDETEDAVHEALRSRGLDPESKWDTVGGIISDEMEGGNTDPESIADRVEQEVELDAAQEGEVDEDRVREIVANLKDAGIDPDVSDEDLIDSVMEEEGVDHATAAQAVDEFRGEPDEDSYDLGDEDFEDTPESLAEDWLSQHEEELVNLMGEDEYLALGGNSPYAIAKTIRDGGQFGEGSQRDALAQDLLNFVDDGGDGVDYTDNGDGGFTDDYGADFGTPADNQGISDDLGDEPAPLTPEEEAFEAPDATPENAPEASVKSPADLEVGDRFEKGGYTYEVTRPSEGMKSDPWSKRVIVKGVAPQELPEQVIVMKEDAKVDVLPKATVPEDAEYIDYEAKVLDAARSAGATDEQISNMFEGDLEAAFMDEMQAGEDPEVVGKALAGDLADMDAENAPEAELSPAERLGVTQEQYDSYSPWERSLVAKNNLGVGKSRSDEDAAKLLDDETLQALVDFQFTPEADKAVFRAELDSRGGGGTPGDGDSSTLQKYEDLANSGSQADALAALSEDELRELASDMSIPNSSRAKFDRELERRDAAGAADDAQAWLDGYAGRDLTEIAGNLEEAAADSKGNPERRKALTEWVEGYLDDEDSAAADPEGWEALRQTANKELGLQYEAGDSTELAPDAPNSGGAPGTPSPSTPSADSADAKAVRLSLTNSSTGKGIELDQARVDAVFANPDHEAGHKDLAKIMTELKLGGKQRKRLRELLDRHYGENPGESDSAAVQAAEVADNLSPDNPLKERLAAKAAEAAPSAPDADPGLPMEAGDLRDGDVVKMGSDWLPIKDVQHDLDTGRTKYTITVDGEDATFDRAAFSKMQVRRSETSGDAFNTAEVIGLGDEGHYEINGIDFKYQGDGVWTDGDGTPGVRPDIVARLQERYDADHNLPAADVAPTAPSAPEGPAAAPQAAESPNVGADAPNGDPRFAVISERAPDKVGKIAPQDAAAGTVVQAPDGRAYSKNRYGVWTDHQGNLRPGNQWGPEDKVWLPPGGGSPYRDDGTFDPKAASTESLQSTLQGIAKGTVGGVPTEHQTAMVTELERRGADVPSSGYKPPVSKAEKIAKEVAQATAPNPEGAAILKDKDAWDANYTPGGTPTKGAKIYDHPMGARIYVFPDGSMEAYGANGKKKSTSATPEKLAAGHGQWKEVPSAGQESVGSQAPTKPDFEGAYAGVLDGKSQADGLRDLVAARKARIAEIDKELDGFMKGVTLGPLAQKNRDALYDERSKLEKEASALDRKRRVIAPTQAEVLQDLNDYDPSDEEPPNIDLSTAISAFSAELSKDGPDAPTYLAKINGVEVSLSNAQVKALLGKA